MLYAELDTRCALPDTKRMVSPAPAFHYCAQHHDSCVSGSSVLNSYIVPLSIYIPFSLFSILFQSRSLKTSVSFSFITVPMPQITLDTTWFRNKTAEECGISPGNEVALLMELNKVAPHIETAMLI